MNLIFDLQEAFKAKKICSERGVFEETNFADCPSAVASEIAEILEVVLFFVTFSAKPEGNKPAACSFFIFLISF